jgi:hypothetical protein
MSEPIKIEPVELKINLYTNIPKGGDYETETLTFDKLSTPDLKIDAKIKPSQYPFFTFQIKYDESKLSKLEYNDVVKTFFIKDLLVNSLRSAGDTDLENKDLNIMSDEEKKEYDVKRQKNIDNNIMIMLKYLLPTRFPVINNHYSSYDIVKNIDRLNTLFYNPFSSRKPIFLKLSSGTYTVKKVIWINDILNHPSYKKSLKDDTVELKRFGKSSNYLLEDHIRSTKDRNSSKKLSDINKCYNTVCGNLDKCVYVGIQMRDTVYEIFVDIELFEDELKPEDEDKVKCPYYGDYLGEELERMLEDMKPENKEKIVKGELIKMPLFSTKTLVSRKKGYKEKEEIEELSEETKEKRKREDSEYNDLPEETRDSYEFFIKKFFEKVNKSTLKPRLKRYDINYKNFFLDFFSIEGRDRNKLKLLYDHIMSRNNEDRPKIDKFAYIDMLTYINRNIDYYSDPTKVRNYNRSELQVKLLQYELAKELLKGETNDAIREEAQKQIDTEEAEEAQVRRSQLEEQNRKRREKMRPAVGGNKTNKLRRNRIKKSKNKHTRRRR